MTEGRQKIDDEDKAIERKFSICMSYVFFKMKNGLSYR